MFNSMVLKMVLKHDKVLHGVRDQQEGGKLSFICFVPQQRLFVTVFAIMMFRCGYLILLESFTFLQYSGEYLKQIIKAGTFDDRYFNPIFSF